MRKLILWITLVYFLSGIPLSVWAEEKNTIRFISRNATSKTVKTTCENFSYPRNFELVGTENAFTVRPAGFIQNPRNLEYTCRIYVPYSGSVAVSAETISPVFFDHTKPDSVVILTIHAYEKSYCFPRWDAFNEVLLTYSLSVDGNLIKDRVTHCFYNLAD